MPLVNEMPISSSGILGVWSGKTVDGVVALGLGALDLEGGRIDAQV
jgi:hypothetical protein